MDSAQGRTGHGPSKKVGKKKVLTVLIGLVIVAAAIVAMGFFLGRTSTASTINGSKYQAVFFTNGQVYFGKLSQVNREYFSLKKVFYIQGSASEAQSDSKNPQQTSDQNANIELVKLGNEVHGPDDEMIISRDQILFFENLKSDGKVSSSINQYNNKQ